MQDGLPPKQEYAFRAEILFQKYCLENNSLFEPLAPENFIQPGNMYYFHILQEQVRYRFLRAFDVVRRRDGNSDDGASVAVKREDDVTTVSHTARVLLEGEIYGSLCSGRF